MFCVVPCYLRTFVPEIILNIGVIAQSTNQVLLQMILYDFDDFSDVSTIGGREQNDFFPFLVFGSY